MYKSTGAGRCSAARRAIRAGSASDRLENPSPALRVHFLAIALMGVGAAARAEEQPSSFERLLEARGLFLQGHYEEAVEHYQSLASDAGSAVAAHVAWTDVDEQLGRYTEAVERLRGIEAAAVDSADWHTALAAMLSHVGDYQRAVEHARHALRLNPEQMRARRLLGGLFEMLGLRNEAIETYEWFDKQMRVRLPETAEDLTYAGQGFYRYSVLTRHENLAERCRYVLRDVYQEAFEFVDSRYWPARLAAADLLAEKHNLYEAEQDYGQVLETNARSAEAHAGLSRVALERWDFDKAEKHALRALEINPRSTPALMAQGRLRMLERKFDAAAETAERILAFNPRSLEGLSLLAAAQTRAGRPAAVKETLRRVRSITPRCAMLHHELGVWQSAARQFTEAEKHFRRAIELDPTWSDPRTELGLMHMQTGEDAAARAALTGSWELDPFNHQTFNVLNLLDELDRFSRMENERFVLKYDAAEDAVLASPFMSRLDRIFRDVTEMFGERPSRRTTVEVFPTHMRFSVRVTGRPWIQTVGACTGPVIAMTAPRSSPEFGSFNWERTLRHEFAHTVTLAATDNRIPHWMTEGLAVHAEETPRPWNWCVLLTEALRRDRLFDLETIDWGFMRPKRPTDRTLAYAQSQWMIEYIIAQWGFERVLEALAAFREGKTQEQVFEVVLGVPTEEFSRDFVGWARGQASAWGLPLDPLPPRDELEHALEKATKEAEPYARLAEALLLDGEPRRAKRLARRALALNEENVRALRVLCLVLTGTAEAEKNPFARLSLFSALEEPVRRLVRLSPEDADALRCLAAMEQAREKWDAAAEAWTRYQGKRPGDPESYRRLGGLYLNRDDVDSALPQLERLHALTGDDAVLARRIGRIYLDRGRVDAAVLWYERAVEIDPYDAETYRRLGRWYERLGRVEEAVQAYRGLCVAAPDDPQGYERLTELYTQQGRDDEAAAHRKQAIERGAVFPDAPDEHTRKEQDGER
jgi:tetratricopeptide (TPR) repeat protein